MHACTFRILRTSLHETSPSRGLLFGGTARSRRIRSGSTARSGRTPRQYGSFPAAPISWYCRGPVRTPFRDG